MFGENPSHYFSNLEIIVKTMICTNSNSRSSKPRTNQSIVGYTVGLNGDANIHHLTGLFRI